MRDGDLAALAAALGEQGLAAAREAGRVLTVEEAIDEVKPVAAKNHAITP